MNNVDRILRQTLSDWSRWQVSLPGAPRRVRELEGGLTNRSFLVESGAHLGVVRVNAGEDQRLGIDRQRELAVLKLLQGSGFVPDVWFASRDVLVTEFVEGRHWQGEDLYRVGHREQVHQLIQRLQQVAMPSFARRFSYLDHCRGYLAQLAGFPEAEEVLALAAGIDASDWQPVICHHDLVVENIIETERGLVLIDWEYAGWGHPAMDGVRLFGGDYPHRDAASLHELQKSMDRLWQAVQDRLDCGSGRQGDGGSCDSM
ncbi:MAG: choline/ethanolamine kinase family protein [Porticoccaceae bacterium]